MENNARTQSAKEDDLVVLTMYIVGQLK